MEDLAHVDAAGDQVVAGGVDVVHGEDQAARRAGLGRRDSLAEDDRGFRVVRRHLHDAEVVARREVGVEPPAEILVERLRAVDVGNAEHHDFELHVDRFDLPRRLGLSVYVTLFIVTPFNLVESLQTPLGPFV